jgi:hypothetical protein
LPALRAVTFEAKKRASAHRGNACALCAGLGTVQALAHLDLSIRKPGLARRKERPEDWLAAASDPVLPPCSQLQSLHLWVADQEWSWVMTWLPHLDSLRSLVLCLEDNVSRASMCDVLVQLECLEDTWLHFGEAGPCNGCSATQGVCDALLSLTRLYGLRWHCPVRVDMAALNDLL